MKRSATETCLCGSGVPFIFIRIHMKSPLAASCVSINSSKMIGIKGSKHSLLTKANPRFPPAAPCPPPSLSPPLTGPIVRPSQSSCTTNKDIKVQGPGLVEVVGENTSKGEKWSWREGSNSRWLTRALGCMWKAAKTQRLSANVPAQAFLPLIIHCAGLPIASQLQS